MKMKLMKALALTFALAAGMAARAAGDLIEILPCDATGTTLAVPVSSVADPIDCTAHYFKLRLVNRIGYTASQPWVMVPKVAGATDPLKMYVYISGELREATYTGTTVPNGLTTDFVFSFTPRAGDLALPVVLATTAGRADVSGLTEGVVKYRLANDHLWGIYPNGDTTQAEAVLILNDSNEVHASRPEGGDWSNDYSLAGAGFYVKEVDFDSNAYSDTVWRSINSNDTTCVNTALPMLKVNSPENTSSAFVYVWTKDPDVVVVDGNSASIGTEYAIDGTDEDGQSLKTKGLRMQVAANSDSKSFYLKAVGAVGATTTLFMADTPTNIYYNSGSVIPNFVTRTVKVDVPNPPAAKLYFNGEASTTTLTLDADADYQTTKATVMVELSEPYTADVTVTLGAKYTDATVVDLAANDYISLSTTDGTASWSQPAAQVTIPAGSTMATLYLHVLGGSSQTKDGIILSVASIDGAGDHYATGAQATLSISPTTPKIANPANGAVFEGALTGESFLLEDFRIDDTYANRLKGTTEGYTVFYKRTYAAGGGDAKFQSVTFTNAIDGTAKDTANVLGLKLAKAGTATVTMYLQAPDGTKTATADYVTFTVEVTQSPQVTAQVTSGLNADGTASEGATLQVKFFLSDANSADGNLYAFLVPADEATSNNVDVCTALATNGMTGVEILNGESASRLYATLKFKDGSAIGELMTFNVFLSEDKTLGAPDYATYPDYGYKAYDGYADGSLMVYVVNEIPTVALVQLNGVDGTAVDGNIIEDVQTSQGIACTFATVVNEPSSTDLNALATDGEGSFYAQYTFYDGASLPQVITVRGNPNALSTEGVYTTVTNFTFQTAGTNKVTVALKDKDMDAYGDKFTFYVIVNATPGVEITSGRMDASAVYPEDETGSINAPLAVRLTAAPNEELTVGLKVDYAVAGDTFALPKLSLPVENREITPGVFADVYVVTFNAGYRNPKQNIYFTSIDGTVNSELNGVTITPYVLTDTPSPYAGKTYRELYTNLVPFTMYPRNIDPVIVTPAEASETVTNKTSIGVDNVVNWAVRDIAGDFAPNATVAITVEGVTTVISNNIDVAGGSVRTAAGTYKFQFDSTGPKTVILTVTDKDGKPASRNIFYMIDPSKNVHVYPHGANRSNVSSISSPYVNAQGLGTGYVWQDGTLVGDTAKKFTNRRALSFGVTATSATFAGMGDMTGWLGNGAASTLAYDSYLYGWIVTAGGEATFTGYSPHYGTYADYAAAFADADNYAATVTLPSADEFDETANAYADRFLEAIFSREWRAADNMGDINADGVPDFFAIAKSYANGTVQEADGTGAEARTQIDTLNDDLDFLPGRIAVPLAPSTWSGDDGSPFTARLEVRGSHNGLNYGMFRADKKEAADGWVSDLDLSLAEKLCLVSHAQANAGAALADALLATLPASYVAGDLADGWLTPTNAAEQAVAKAYIDWTWSGYEEGDEPAKWGFTVENRTDPTSDDTDGDGLPDGYEYALWYAATVGSVDATGNRTTITGARFDLSDIESTDDVITSADIAAIYNPNAYRKSAEQDTDNDGLFDLEEMLIGTSPIHWDTDSDGLSDLYEVLYNLNPLKAATDNNTPDGETNHDGDFMARASTMAAYRIVESATGELWAFSTYTYSDDGTAAILTGAGFPVARFNGGYIPRTLYVTEELMTQAATLTFATGTTLDSHSVIFSTLDLYHAQVYWYKGFDPRTGWYVNGNNGSLSPTKRWLKNNAPIPGGTPVDTAAYTAHDEYLLLKFRQITGMTVRADQKQTIHGYVTLNCTNPSAETEAGATIGDGTKEYGACGNGADTDSDGVPDGWELYIGVDPQIDFRIPKSSSGHDPLYWDGYTDGYGNLIAAIGDNSAYDDGLTLVGEYAGTDSTLAFADCESIYANHPSQAGSVHVNWFNKFFPTDPRQIDTDGDGINDGAEGASWSELFTMNRWGQRVASNTQEYREITHNFIYGSPSDNGSLCIRGGGLNPSCLDTDGDGLPDPWERQYAGALFTGSTIVESQFKRGAPDTTIFNDIAAALLAFGSSTNVAAGGYHILMGMDGTTDDAATEVQLGSPDLDWDGDGLQNWQEYMVQAMRHFRYDDFHTPLMGFDVPKFDLGSGTYLPGGWFGRDENGEGQFLEMSYSTRFTSAELATLQDLGYTNFVDFVTRYEAADETRDYLRDLGYLALPPREWDHARVDLGKRYMLPPKLIQEKPQVTTTRLPTVWKFTDGTEVDLTDSTTYASGTVATGEIGAFSFLGMSWFWDEATGKSVEPYILTTTNLVFTTTDAAGYVGTDPRLWDTDEDGMDDYWELFHGLNPILGDPGQPSEADVTIVSNNVTFVEKITTYVGAKDVIYDRYYSISAWKNGWVGFDREWDAADKTPPLDAIRYPWMMGTGMCDADGDGLRNEEEALMANLASPDAYHTDPSPLWMTDSTVASFQVPVKEVETVTTNLTTVAGLPVLDGTGNPIAIDMVVTNVSSYLTFRRSPSYTALYYNDDAMTASPFGAAQFASYELNEGYDTDGDFRSDKAEMEKVVEATSDPLDFDDIRRRQSIHFGGSADPGVALTFEPIRRNANGQSLFRQFTVEAWVRPEDPASGERQYIVTRGINYPAWDLLNSNTVVRLNFALGIDESGRSLARFDSSTDEGYVEITGSALDAEKWVHLALTFDGGTLRLYENAKEVKSQPTPMIPANGVHNQMQDPQYERGFPYNTYSAYPAATALGGSPRAAAFEAGAAAGATWDKLAGDFFKGSVDEVRIWDGARTLDQIAADYKKRYTVDDVKAQRADIFVQRMNGRTRNDNDGAAMLDAELIQHYNFTAMPSATEPQYAQKLPAGFEANVLKLVRDPDDAVMADLVKVGWWNDILTNATIAANQVYSSPHIVPWIQNTVGHLPRLSGTVQDSVYWSENYAGYTPATFHANITTFTFPNALNPYNLASLKLEEDYALNKFLKLDAMVKVNGEEFGVYSTYYSDIRYEFTGTSDLLPLGSAYAQRLAESWDGEGPEDVWAITTDGTALDGDPDGAGIPQWARDAGYTTAEAYAEALKKGLLPDGALNDTYSRDYYFTQLAKDATATRKDENGNGIPDWWETYFGIYGCDANGDEDNDGLSNFQEYLISFGDYGTITAPRDDWSFLDLTARNTGMPLLDPTKAHSPYVEGGEVKTLAVVDYFRKPDFTQLKAVWADHVAEGTYLGQMVTDHDLMELAWEQKYANGYANAFVYDSHLDIDGDGWDNFSEARTYYWRGGMVGSLIDRFLLSREQDHLLCYPQPAIGVKVTYYGVRDVTGKSLVVRTMTSNSKRVDAMFVVPSKEQAETGNTGIEAHTVVGLYPGELTVRGFLDPGCLLPGSGLKFVMREVNVALNYQWECTYHNIPLGTTSYEAYRDHLSNCRQADENSGITGVILKDTPPTSDYEQFVIAESYADGMTGYLRTIASDTRPWKAGVVGKINFITGEYELDLAKVKEYGVDLEGMVIAAQYQYRTGDYWPQTVWLSQAELGTGRVKQGKNTIEAFFDLNANGIWDDGEPYGMVRNVDIGWHRTGEPIPIELSDESRSFTRAYVSAAASAEDAPASDSLTTSVVVRRIAINGKPMQAARTLKTMTVVNDDRAYVTEADVITDDRPDFDWAHLIQDAEAMGIKQADVQKAEYEILANGEVVSTFARSFKYAKPKAVAVSPIQTAPVYTARPTFTFVTDDETVTAYRLQVTDETGAVLWDSGDAVLPGRVSYTPEEGSTYRITPELYVDTFATTNGTPGFVDGGKYGWRVALLNAKYTTVESDDDWSAPADFRMDVRNRNQNPDVQTGYGKVATAVRYYGAGKVQAPEDGKANVIVEAYGTADFTGAPLARMRLGDISMLDSADDVTATNVVLRGIEASTDNNISRVYLMAYIDSNNNARRDAWESWGYANSVGVTNETDVVDALSINTPVGIDVTDILTHCPSNTIYIEDTDINQNEMPDILEDFASEEAEVLNLDRDKDGLKDVDEVEVYGTDPELWDTDGDGMPDGWEAVFAGLNPFADDAAFTGTQDVMAYVVTNLHVAVTVNDEGKIDGRYVMIPYGREEEYETSSRYYTTFDYNGALAMGGPAPDDVADRVRSIEVREVIVVHGGVYDLFGFDPTTANPEYTGAAAVEEGDAGEGEAAAAATPVYGANTKPFTALDKYLVARYLETFGIADEEAMNLNGTWAEFTLRPGDYDSDANGLPDGWELYMNFACGNAAPAFKLAVGDAQHTSLTNAFAAAGELIRNPYDDEYFYNKAVKDGFYEGDLGRVPAYDNAFAIENGIANATAEELAVFWNYAPAEDWCAYVETNCLIAVVTDSTTGDQTTYAVRPGSEDLYTTIDVKGQLYIGRFVDGAALPAGEFRSIITNVVVMHAAVYDWFGWDVTTARPDFFVPRQEEYEDEANSIQNALASLLGGGTDEEGATASAANHANSAAFSRLIKYITQKYYLAEFGAQNDYDLYSEGDDPDWWTDTNGNDIPDGWELYVKHSKSADPSKDDDDYKQDFGDGTDPNSDDTDGDGIPDDAERALGSDPAKDDGSTAIPGDVMAYAELKNQTVFTVYDGTTTNMYVVLDSADGARKIQVGDTITSGWAEDFKFATAFEYGSTNAWVYGVGAVVSPAVGESWPVVAVTNATVALVHAQVYDRYGFNPQTANPTVSSNEWSTVHSKAFTYLDKFLVTKWLEACGVADAAACTLDVTTADTNGNGIPDGWELYVMFGPAGATATIDAAKISPWKSADYVRDYANTPDGGRLTILDEYDQGSWPTDPWSIDTDGDGVFDVYAYCYHLKGDQAGADADGDGLSNYAEYLVSEVFQIVKVDPNQAMTDGSTLDYYRKFGELYLGEVFTDHDRVSDLWEALYERGTIDGIDYAARGIYDPDADRDGDGWSNYAEFRAGTSPARQTSAGIDDFMLIEHPVPVVEMEVVYNGTADIEGRTLTVKAWNEADDPDALKAPTATWTVSTVNESGSATQQNTTTSEEVREKYIGQMPTGTRTFYLGSGAIKEGSFKLCIKDKNYVEGQIVELLGQRYFQPTGYGDADAALWYYDVIDQGGKLVQSGGIFAESHQVGTIDYDTGRVTIDFDDEEFTDELYVGDPSQAAGASGNNGNNDSTTTYHGLNPPTCYVKLVWSPATTIPVKGRHYLSDATTGFLREGATTFTVEAAAADSDVDQNSTSTAKARLYGVVRGVDVGWAGAKFTVELTDFSPVTPRIDLWTGTPDRTDAVPFDDSRINNASNTLEAVTAEGSLARVRVVRYAINGYPIYATWGAGLADVVYERTFSAAGRTQLNELDFLQGAAFDIDWTDSFTNKVANANGVPYGTYANTNGQVPGPAGTNPAGAGDIMAVLGSSSLNHTYEPVTNIQYMVVVGDGAATWEHDGTNVVSSLSTLITRRFDHVRARPVAVAVDGLQYAARPIFTWRMEGEEALVSRYGSSYTAFKLQVKNAAGTVIYDSGVRRAPATDADGNFTWTAPICAGSLLKGEDGNAYFYDTTGNYTWQVTMYNAKFRSDFWSAQNGASVFTTAVNEQQEVNDHGYSSIKAAVKYAGPSNVVSKVANLTELKGKVIVQAFTTPDFSGAPLAQGLATNEVDNLVSGAANASLKGLAAIGTYYVRAFIDMDGDGELDEWEPWGYAKDAVTLVNDGTMPRAQLVAVWIEDSDTDGDWVPDAYEYAATGWSIDWDRLKGNWDDLYELSGADCPDETTRTTRLLSNGGIVMPISQNLLTSAGISKGLPGASFTAMQRADFVVALLGLDLSNKTTLEAIAEVTRGKLVPNSVRVVGIALEPDGSAVNLTVNADVASGISGTVVSQYYEFTGSDTVHVLVKVLKKDSLEDTDWTLVYTTPEPVAITPQTNETVVVPFDEQLDLKSGFFKVKLKEVVVP